MTDLNSVTLIGRLTRDVDVSYISSGTACGKFSLAVNESKKGASGKWTDVANYFDVILWGKLAENLKMHLLKGKMVAVKGHLKQDRWEKDGQKLSKVSIVAESVQLCGGTSSGNSNGNRSGNSYPADNGEFTEDIPF